MAITVPTTSGADLSRLDFNDYIARSLPTRTHEAPVQRDPNYKEAGISSTTQIGTELKLQTAVKGDETASPSAAHREGVGCQSFKGVVDRIDPVSSSVTLFYDGRENAFLFPTPLLEEAGAAYAGALFEIVMTREDGFHSYDIVHLPDEEKRARADGPPADLSFLDGIEGAPRANRK